MPSITGVHHLSFSVTNRKRSVLWYQEVFGFERHSEVEADTFRRTRMRHPDCGITITLTQHDQASGGRFDERRTGLDHLALRVGDIDDLHAWKRRFEERGVDHSEIKERGVGAGAITRATPTTSSSR